MFQERLLSTQEALSRAGRDGSPRSGAALAINQRVRTIERGYDPRSAGTAMGGGRPAVADGESLTDLVLQVVMALGAGGDGE